MALPVGNSPTGYNIGGSSPGPSAAANDDEQQEGFWPLSKCRRAYTAYLDSKTAEIEEQQTARRYRHGAQWTPEQIKTLNDRKQPVVTYNRVGRKIDGIVGLTEKLRQDPKAFPRTPIHQQGADLATACLRYILDSNKWPQVSPTVSESAAIDGLAGIELGLERVRTRSMGDTHTSAMPQEEDFDVTFQAADNDGFFYDPRSFKHDFSDARYMGIGKWVDLEMIKELMPELADKLDQGGYNAADLTSNSDRDTKWFSDNGRDFKQIRLVDIWYKSGRGWNWAIFTGGTVLMQGPSPFTDQYGGQVCKYVMFSAAIDHDGDRYGFPRNLMSAQDEINQRRSKALHELNNRRIRATKAAVADTNVEALRREAARSDGIILTNTSIDDVQFDDQAKQMQIMGQLEMLKEAKAEIENFGPNPAVLGDAGIGAKSGRAIALLQQAGIAELGPYMINLRAWKIRVYTALFNAAQQYWTQSRWIRVTDNQGEQQFVGINMPSTGEDGMPTTINPIGELDVDIILDEGPDTVTLMQDTYDAIAQALPAIAPMLTPDKAMVVMEVMIETSPLPADVKKKFRDASQQGQQGPSPEQQKMLAEQENDKAKLAIQAQGKQQDIELKRTQAMADLQIERERADQEMAIEREKAVLQVELEREKANNAMDLKRFEAAQRVQHEADGFHHDIEMKTAQFRDGLVQERQKQHDDRAGADKLNAALAQLVSVIGQSHQGMLAAINKPRRAVFERDPRTNKITGATSSAAEG